MPERNIPIITPYNPLDKSNLGTSVAEALLHSSVHRLPPEPFIGAGVYALYYSGDFAPYAKLTEMNAKEYRIPIYVGKAVPAGARRGGNGLNVEHGRALCDRLAEHTDSLCAASNIEVTDFVCRYLVTDDIWIPLAEALMIEMFKPLWNCCIDGFGNHDPGRGRYQQRRSPWDCLHEGREWAYRLKPNAQTREELERRVVRYLNETY